MSKPFFVTYSWEVPRDIATNPPTLSSDRPVYYKTKSPVSAFFAQYVTCAAGSLYFRNQDKSEYLNGTKRLSKLNFRAHLYFSLQNSNACLISVYLCFVFVFLFFLLFALLALSYCYHSPAVNGIVVYPSQDKGSDSWANHRLFGESCTSAPWPGCAGSLR